jgi:hypothetical protein
MSTWKRALAGCLAAALAAVSAPAQAQHITISDPAGDADQPGLDITSAVVANRDRAVVTTITYTHDRPSKVVVAIDPRHLHRNRFEAIKHYRSGPDKSVSLCSGVTSHWNRAKATQRLRLPARCIHAGNYGAVRVWVFTEALHSSRDVDIAPQRRRNGDIRWTNWIPRG